MASGGPRGNTGRRPDPGAGRRERASDRDGWALLPRVCDVSAPDWPLTGFSDRECEVWERLWLRPQAFMWHELFLVDEVALYVRYLVEAEQPEAPASVRTLVKQHQELLGISTAGMLRNRWRVAPVEVGPVVSSTPSEGGEVKRRLRAVNE